MCSLGLPWNCGRASVLFEMGFLPAEVLWELICLKACAKIMRDKSNAVARVIEAGNITSFVAVDGVKKGEGRLATVVKSLERDWGVNVKVTQWAQSKKLAQRRGAKGLLKCGVAGALRAVRTGYGNGVPRYLHLERRLAASIARFRFGYGPDRVSLSRRGLWRGELGCRWCGPYDGVEEDADHLLLRCIDMGFLTHSLWRSKSLVEVIGDQVKWDVGAAQVLADVYERGKEGEGEREGEGVRRRVDGRKKAMEKRNDHPTVCRYETL